MDLNPEKLKLLELAFKLTKKVLRQPVISDFEIIDFIIMRMYGESLVRLCLRQYKLSYRRAEIGVLLDLLNEIFFKP